jgi:hypothetical protein
MKKLLYLFTILLSFTSVAQISGSFSVNWKDAAASEQTAGYQIATFQNENLYFNPVIGIPELVIKLPVTASIDEASVQMSDIVFEEVTSAQLGEIKFSALTSKPTITVNNIRSRENLSAVITVSPIIREQGIFKRIKSFTYTARAGNAPESVMNRGFDGISSSVLATGEWYRFYVEKSGVYKISKSFLQQLGLKVNKIDPRNIRIYGNGGRMLPLSNAVEYPADLEENAIYVHGEQDGSLDSQDYILFYAEGVDNWSAENNSHNNLYGDRAYYYVTVQGNGGKRISSMPPPATASVTPINVFDDYQFYERDLTNVARLGRNWYGEQFGVQNSRSFNFSFPRLASGSTVQITVAGAAVSYTETSFGVKVNGSEVGSIHFPRLTILNTTTQGYSSQTNVSVPAATEYVVDLEYNTNGVPGSRGYLDYIILRGKSNLSGIGKQFRFQYNDAAITPGNGQFTVSNASTIDFVWDITDIYNVTSVQNAGESTFSFVAPLGEVRKYIAVDRQDYYTPKRDSRTRVANQDLKGTIFKNASGQFQDIDYLIITTSTLQSSAEKLAAFHRSNSGLHVKVVLLDQIYQEFSSGQQDIGAIRNFVKYVYRNASSPQNRVRYLNLFGDASYDFKDRVSGNTNVVPIYHALDSFSLSASYISDDFFVLMDDNEGSMVPTQSTGLDIAVGRMPVSTVAQADEMVNKVIEYHDPKAFGRWRNNFVLISDDVDVPGESTLQQGLDALGDQISANKPFINVKKIHSDSYQQEASAGGNRYPEVRRDFVSALNQGALVFNYFGHGGEDGLAHERILEKSDVQQLNNRYKYPLFITITCEFTRFDNPFRPTAGEYMYWNPKGGAIGLVTTTRQITIGTGQQINVGLSANLFGYGTNDPDSIAEALRVSKSQSSSNPMMVFYIGDPAVSLALPKPKIVLTHVNDMPVSGPVDDLKALSHVKLTGEVRDEKGINILSDYDGELAVNIYDKPIERTTLGNDGSTNAGGLIIMKFMNLGETIFRGNATVKSGAFEFSFVVPKDIRVPVGNGRASFYAKRTGQPVDQTGVDTIIKVGGINLDAAVDNTPPTVKLYMNDESFVSGGITNESPILLAILEDENGINTASGIGHDIIAILDGDESKPYVLNDYYETVADDYRKGRVNFPFRDLAVGLHTLTFTAWDVYNNPITVEIQFLVVGDETLTLKNVLNYPNPFVNYTQFWFTHNRPFEPLEVQVQVMTITGKVVWTKNQVVSTDGFLSRDVTWDGRDDFGDKIGKGVYVYRLTVRSTVSNKKSEKIEKLVIL